jgi:7,8-dihydro-6-hydroxymethylpterin-pyrophosphokinase
LQKDLLLGNDLETNNETMIIARQQLHKYATVLEPLSGTSPYTPTKELLELVFSTLVLQGYITQST